MLHTQLPLKSVLRLPCSLPQCNALVLTANNKNGNRSMMNTKPMSAFFKENLDAPLTNVQWSWGAENEKGCYLRVWEDENKDGCCLVYLNAVGDARLGQTERLRHINIIKQGKPGYVIQITEGIETDDGKWKIKAYQESILRIKSFSENEAGDIYAEVDFDDPIYSDFIGKEINVDEIKQAAESNKKASELLEKAMSRFGWRPTQICPDGEVISLISKDGRQFAKLIISSAKWVRE